MRRGGRLATGDGNGRCGDGFGPRLAGPGTLRPQAYDPDGDYDGDRIPNDVCDYDSNGDGGVASPFLMESLVYPAVYLLWKRRAIRA